MSTIIFNRRFNYLQPNEACDTEEEVEEENYNFTKAAVDSKNYLVNLYKNLKNCNYLLNSLIAKEKLDYIVICLYKNHEFSFGIKSFNTDCVCETVRFICEDNHILNYIDNEELPPILIDVIERLWLNNIYYNGCIISEIRDYRQSSSTYNFFNSYFILLKPTSLSLYNDVKKVINLTNKNYIWSNLSRFKFESKLIYLTSPKLCLDPNPCIGLLSKKLSRKKLIFCNKLFLRLPRKRLKKTIFLNEKLKEFKLLNFLDTKKPYSLQRIKSNPMSQNSSKSNNFEYKDVKSIAKDFSDKTNDSYDLIKVEEYTMEFIEIPSNTFTKLIIFWRPFDDIYFGNLVNNKNGDCKGLPNFYLGNKSSMRKYIEQFIEIFTENGRKSIKITHQTQKEQPKIRYTPAAELYIKKKMALKNESTNNLNAKEGPNSMLIKNEIDSTGDHNFANQNIIKTEQSDSINRSFQSSSNQIQSATIQKSNLIGQVPGNTIRLPNVISVQGQRFTVPITLSLYPSSSTVSSSNSGIKSFISIKDQSKLRPETLQLNEQKKAGKDSETNNMTVTYLPANIFMSGSTVFTVQPSMQMDIANSLQSSSLQQSRLAPANDKPNSS